jgi:hypothetical protein
MSLLLPAILLHQHFYQLLHRSVDIESYNISFSLPVNSYLSAPYTPYMKVFRIVIALVTIWLGFKSVQEVFNGLEDGLFGIEYFPLAFLIIFTLGAFLTDRYHYHGDKKLYQYSTSAIGFIFCGFVFFKLIQFKAIDYSKTVLLVTNLPGATNVLHFDFKNNNRFSVTDFSILSSTVFYGWYEKQHDTIFIGNNNYSGYANKLPVAGVIKGDTVYWNKFDTMIVYRRRD